MNDSKTHTKELVPRAPVFIVGFARSGTTLLRALLGAHSRIQLADEPEILRAIRAAGFSLTCQLQPADRPKLLAAINTMTPAKEHLAALEGRSHNWLFSSSNEPIDGRTLYESLLGVAYQADVWGEKSLGNLFHIEEILNVYPNALFIHIVRDPRGALLSLYRKRFSNSTSISPPFNRHSIRFFGYRASEWNAWMEALAMQVERVGGSSVVELKYEALVQDPESELRRLCACLNLPFESSMLDVERRRNDPSLSSSGSYSHRAVDQPIDATRANALDEIPPFANEIISTVSAKQLTQFGYSPWKGHLPLTSRLRIRAELLYYRSEVQRRISELLHSRFSARNVRSASDTMALSES